ncbi:MAG: phage integrase SAM-like domain-containing protein, partial [Duncaniella sp.]|nr:phage integrase SAM-like domain-containing protein [Duncaniella sp.]
MYTGLHISYAEWDARRSAIVLPEKCGSGRGSFLAEAVDRVVSDMARLEDIVERLERSGRPYSSDNVVAMFNRSEAEGGVVSFGRRIIEDMRRIGKLSMARRYEVALNSFLRFTGNKDVAWRDFNSTLVAGYEEFLRKRGLCRNSTSFYMRNLRSIVNRAQECD